MFGEPRLAINEYLGVGYCVTFPWTNYDSKNGPVWDLTQTHGDKSLPLWSDMSPSSLQNHLLSP